jgi:serine/threonine-protein kinase
LQFARGTRFGPFEIDALLGAGGMGEVYRARDTRLDRAVAIKVLPPHAAADAESRVRFEREARAISTLNHASICTLHDIGRDQGTDYLVMELVDGEALADRIRRGPLPFEEVLGNGELLADALAVAHRHGIVHRDVKPGNVMVTRSGLKLLDFGLATLRAGAPLVQDAARARATTKAALPLSSPGSVMGTFQYMSPEQVEGRVADARSDIWALGCVLFEMATGKPPFDGQTPAGLTASILGKAAPALVTFRSGLPRSFERVVHRCLAKDPEARWQSAADLAFALRSIAAGSADDVEAITPRRNSRRRQAAWAAVTLACMLAVGGTVWAIMGARRPPDVTRLARFVVSLAPGERLPTAIQPVIALSPDARLLVYVAERDNTSRLYLRWLDKLHAEALPGTEGGVAPFFSPDGQWIAFFAERKLKKVPVAGGAAVTLCDAPDAWGGSWGDDGTIVFNGGGFKGLFQVRDSGGPSWEWTVPDRNKGEWEHEWPHVLPAGVGTIFSAMTFGSFDAARVNVLQPGGAPRVLVQGGFAPRYLSSEHLLYARRRAVFAMPFDRSRLETTGVAVRVLEGVQTAVTGATQLAVSRDGTLAYVPGDPDRRVMRIDRNATRTPLLDSRGVYSDLSLSPDGTRLAMSIESEKSIDIWVADLARGTLTRLTSGAGLHGYPTWSHDGRRIAFFASYAGETNKLYWQPADGSGPAERLTTGEFLHSPSAFSPDGKHLVWGEFRPETGDDLWVLPLHGDRRPRPLLRTTFNEHLAVFSPDGRYISYASDESGRDEVYVVGSDGTGPRWPISANGGSEPHWVGGEIVYRSGDRVMSAAVRTSPAFSADKPRVRFDGWFESCPLPGCRSFEVTPDGRDLVVLDGSRGPATEIHVVLGWFRDLEALMRK